MLTDVNSKQMQDIPESTDTTLHGMDSPAEVLAFPASPAQESFVYLEKLNPKFPAFNIAVRFTLDGTLDLTLLEQACRALVMRHEGLRTSFAEEDGQLLQIIAPQANITLPVADIPTCAVKPWMPRSSGWG